MVCICRLKVFSLVVLVGLMPAAALRAQAPDRADDPYVRYVTTAPEFQPVRQDPAFLLGRWNTWIYMPWRYQWSIGTGEAGGRFCRDFGFNGGFTDHGAGPLDWLARWNLRFYNDHTAGKGDLYLHGANNQTNFQGDQRDPRAIQHGTDGPRPINAELVRRYFAHGNRGMIGWVEGWFDGAKPRPWLEQYKATLHELGRVQGPKLAGSRWIHDGVAVYYSHPSIQVSWCLDIEPHGKTWINRNNDHRLGTSHNVRKAWEYLLADSGIQYSFLAYDELIRRGVPSEYKVLILPACYALSDAEAGRIREFCNAGGIVVADFACGLFDQHGKGRNRGALDDLFGVSPFRWNGVVPILFSFAS